MTLNQVIRRASQIITSHKQVKTFLTGNVSEFLDDRDLKYPGVFLQDMGGSISISKSQVTVNYQMFFLDLVNVSEDAKTNELDVISDMVLIAMDIIAQMNRGEYSDWKVSADNNMRFVTEEKGDMVAGCVLDISISTPFSQNVCQVPSTYIYIGDDEHVSISSIMIYKYDATGTEGNSFTVAALVGKNVLAAYRQEQYKRIVSSTPIDTEVVQFIPSSGTIGLSAGDTLAAGEHLDFLYT